MPDGLGGWPPGEPEPTTITTQQLEARAGIEIKRSYEFVLDRDGKLWHREGLNTWLPYGSDRDDVRHAP
jgi:hypothetical protein